MFTNGIPYTEYVTRNDNISFIVIISLYPHNFTHMSNIRNLNFLVAWEVWPLDRTLTDSVGRVSSEGDWKKFVIAESSILR